MREMDKAFDFKTAQARWYGVWEEAKVFEAKPESGKAPWSIVIPPPNITGNLHMGHALVNTLHDILTRFKRAQGFDALWVPGTDHAGIATQMMVERQLKAEGKTRHDLTRPEFEQRLWAWKEQNQGAIEHQLKRLGSGVDWTRNRFTLDPALNRAVRHVFVEAYKQGRIYRGPRMIQWDPALQTALSDLEVKHEERRGKLWHLRYPLVDGPVGGVADIVVATTRPETMLGDTAVAVHPEDERYTALVGKLLQHPITGRQIPVVADSFVDPEFGTGCVKLTPAHDPNDFAAGQRLKLPSLTVIGFDAKMTKEAGIYAGLDRFEARKKIVADLEEQGFLVKVEDHTNKIALSDRSGAVLEPLVSEQWFMDVKEAAAQALAAVKEGRIQFTPEHHVAVWEHWLTNIQDWCISRQLVWGHRIPAWTCAKCGELHVAMEGPEACAKCSGSDLVQDPDTLDTWFSSALWPFSVFGWPDETPDLKRYYPTSVLITGYDILFFWVARMAMAGLTWMGEVPFRKVYFNSLVRDASGQKMSKTKGNVIDPLEVMDEYGTDALRFSLAIMAAPGTDIAMSPARLEASRNFCNKLWNAARFVQMNLNDEVTLSVEPELGEAEYWMIGRLRDELHSVTVALEEFRFHEASDRLYHLVYDDFCGTYIELAKVQLLNGTPKQKATILRFLDILLRALHPFVPFLTEEIHEAVVAEHLPEGEPSLLAERSWPLEAKYIQTSTGTEISTRVCGIESSKRTTIYLGVATIHINFDTKDKGLVYNPKAGEPGQPEFLIVPNTKELQEEKSKSRYTRPQVQSICGDWTGFSFGPDSLLAQRGGDASLVPAFQEALSTMLRLKAENGVDPAKRVAALCSVQRLEPFAEALKSIARLESVAFVDGDLASPTRAVAVVSGGAVALELAGLKDPAAEKAKLEKEREKLQQELQALQGRLGNARYLEKAPADEVEKAKAMAEEKQARLSQVAALLG